MDFKNRELDLETFVVSNRLLARRLGKSALAVLAFGLLCAGTWTGIDVARGQEAMERDIRAMASPLVTASHLARFAPPTLAAKQAALIDEGGGTYDVVAIVANPSTRWALLSGTYTVVQNGQTVAKGDASLFPNDERYFVTYGAQLSVANPNAPLSVQFSDVTWRRVAPGFISPDSRLSVEQLAYHVLSSSADAPSSQIVGTLRHTGIETLPSVRLTALLLASGKMVGVGTLALEQVEAASTRPFDVRLTKALGATTVQAVASTAVTEDALR